MTTLKKGWCNIKKRTEIAGPWHDTRHTLVTELPESGARDQTIQRAQEGQLTVRSKRQAQPGQIGEGSGLALSQSERNVIVRDRGNSWLFRTLILYQSNPVGVPLLRCIDHQIAFFTENRRCDFEKLIFVARLVFDPFLLARIVHSSRLIDANCRDFSH